ncbi:MAG: pilus assembly protein N-terminal domain-containing protein [Polyangiales bacterium]
MTTTTRRAFLLASLVGALAAVTAGAQPRPLEVRVGEEKTFPLPRQPQILGSEDPAIATVTVLPDGHAVVRGVSAGVTRIVGRDFGDVPMIFPVVVTAR